MSHERHHSHSNHRGLQRQQQPAPQDVAELERMGIPADALAGPVPVRSGYVVFDELGFEFEHHHRMDRRAFAPSSSSSLTARAWPVMWWPGHHL
jgi:hypothetical protein